LLHQGQFQTVELPNLQLGHWKVKWQKFTQAVSKVQEYRAAASRSLIDLLIWLYDVLSLRVFSPLGWSVSRQWPRRRVWWITASLLSGEISAMLVRLHQFEMGALSSHDELGATIFTEQGRILEGSDSPTHIPRQSR